MKIPTFLECKKASTTREMTKIEVFVYSYSPNLGIDEPIFARMLSAALDETIDAAKKIVLDAASGDGECDVCAAVLAGRIEALKGGE